jgi:hypothetical protein
MFLAKLHGRRKLMQSNELRDAFIEDHQKMTKGLTELIRLVEADEMDRAARKARELDAVIGPHIEFEERRFYPQVQKSRGEDYVRNLYDEHQAGAEAIRALIAIDDPAGIHDAARKRILEQLRTALDHAFSCGTLLSHVTSLPDSDQAELLDDLKRYRREAHVWSELDETRGREEG